MDEGLGCIETMSRRGEQRRRRVDDESHNSIGLLVKNTIFVGPTWKRPRTDAFRIASLRYRVFCESDSKTLNETD